MASTLNTVSTLNGLFKVVYADKLEDLVPDFAVLQKRIEFVSADKETGNYYAQPVNLSQEGGFSYNGSTGASATLNDAIAGQMKEAQVQGSEIILRAQMTYGALARAASSGPKAFKRASAWKVEDMNNSMRKRLELSMLYGQKSIGKVSSVSGSGPYSVVITDATWAGGIWAGTEGQRVLIYNGEAGSDTVKHPGEGTAAQGFVIDAVDSDNKTLVLSGTPANAIATNDLIYFAGTRTSASTSSKEMAGLQKIITNTGDLFNISASTSTGYSLWRGTNLGTSIGQLSHAKLQDYIARAVSKGLMEKVLVLMSPKAFGCLNSDWSALRMFDSSYKESSGKNGFKSLEFVSTNGLCEIVSHPLVKDGDLFILPVDSAMRLGAVELTFGVPGMDEQFFTLVSGTNAVEIQCMADQAVFLEKPGHACFGSGITFA